MEAVAAGHEVAVLARDPSRLASLPPAVTVVTGDVCAAAAVRAVLARAECVLSAIGSAGVAAPGTAISAGMRVIIAGMEACGLARIVALAGGGVLDADGGGLRQDAPGFPPVFRLVSAEHRSGWESLRASALDWTLICTPDLTDAPAESQYRVLADRMPAGGRRVPRADVARFMLNELTAGHYLRRRVGLAN